MKIGIKGISYSATERKYLVRVHKESKRVYLGRFSSLEEAQAALRAHEGETEQQNSNTPMLNSLRAQFAPAKKSNKNKVSVAKPVHKPDVFVLNNKSTKKPSKVKSKKPEVLSKVLKEESSGAVTSDWRLHVTVPTEDIYRRDTGNQILELAIKRLLELAEERDTSVFDVIAQEVARLSKK